MKVVFVEFETEPLAKSKVAEECAKARRQGLEVTALPSGHHICTSASDPRTRYEVSLDHCDCKAHEFRGFCKHQAALLNYYTGR